MNKRFLKLGLMIVAATCVANIAKAQYNELGQDQKNNYISTGIPILQIAPDAICAALGDAGAAYAPNAYSGHWNNAKIAFAPKDLSISTTYTPWLHKLGTDMNFLYLGGYKRLGNRSAVGASLTYFDIGEIAHTGDEGQHLGTFHPNQFMVDVTYAMRLSESLSLGASGRFIHDNLTDGQNVGDMTTKSANALSADVGLYYQYDVDKNQQVAAALTLSNLGSKLSYSDDDTDNEFLPANMRLGVRYTYEIDDYNTINALLDFNKLLVPTPPLKINDSTYTGAYEDLKDYKMTSSMMGVFKSFYDAPGGLSEELREISVSAGAEYWYANTFAARLGYFYEHKTQGGRQYLTAGVGMKYKSMDIDFSYLVPTTNFSNNPLANTIRISLTYNINKKK